MDFKIKRKKTKEVKIGKVIIGGNHPIAVQSMIKIPTTKIEDVVAQINDLERLGCEIIRLAVKNDRDAEVLAVIKKRVRLPLVADIHFHYKLALKAIEAGVDKIRINPGNIFQKDQLKQIISLAREKNIPIRIGVNSGSLRPCYLKQKTIQQALFLQTKDAVSFFEEEGFNNIVISVKSSSIFDMIQLYQKLSQIYQYPLHLGVTATGLFYDGIVKSSIAIGSLLMKGIGDTIRVSLLGQPRDEVICAQNILSALGIRNFGPRYICCPTCGRCQIDLKSKVDEFQRKLTNGSKINLKDLDRYTIAFMGCMVNGPGEAKQADIGLAFGGSKAILFKKGRIKKIVTQSQSVDYLIKNLKEV